MKIRIPAVFVMGWAGLLVWGGCRGGGDRPPPPDARRPVLKSQAELSAERTARLAEGKVTATESAPRLEAENAGGARAAPVPRVEVPAPGPGAIQADILLVNDSILTLPEILYPIRDALAEAKQKAKNPETRRREVERLVVSRVQQAVGSVLIYREATANLPPRQREVIDAGLDRELQRRISRDFGGSQARFERHLSEHGLTLEAYRTLLERELVAREYTREKLLPQITVRRDEILAYYRRNLPKFCTPETRELWLIEAPFSAFLPAGVTWERATASVQAQARLRARRHIQEAYAALEREPFEEVARRYSKGVHAVQGGAWGEIGRPLQPPYDQVSKLIFTYREGQYSEPLETPKGWCIVRCGRINPGRKPTFAELQDQIRQTLTESKLERLSARYMTELAEKATLSGFEAFVEAAVERAVGEAPTARAAGR